MSRPTGVFLFLRLSDLRQWILDETMFLKTCHCFTTNITVHVMRHIIFVGAFLLLISATSAFALGTFDPELASRAYFAQHAAACRLTNCDAGGSWFIRFAGNFGLFIGFGLLAISGLAARVVGWIEMRVSLRLSQAIVYSVIGNLVWRISLLPIAFYFERIAVKLTPNSTLLGWQRMKVGQIFVVTTSKGTPGTFAAWLSAKLFGDFFLCFVVTAICIFIVLWLKPMMERRIWITPLVVAAAIGAYALNTDQIFQSRHYMSESIALPATATSAKLEAMAEAYGISSSKLRVAFDPANPIVGTGDNARAVGFGAEKGILYTQSLIPLPFGSVTINGKAPVPASADILLAITGHEIAHHQGNDLWQLMLFNIVIRIATTALLLLGAAGFVRKHGYRFGIDKPFDVAAWPFYVAIFIAAASFQISAIAIVSRQYETRADRVGLDISRDPDADARLMLRLNEGRPLERSPAEEFFLDDHPSGKARIRAAMQWKAEHQ